MRISNLAAITNRNGHDVTTDNSLNRPEPIRPAGSSRHFVSGLGSGIASAIILQPLDLLKTRVQQSGRSPLATSVRELWQSPHPVANLWRGTVPSALRSGLGSALYFTTLNIIRQRFLDSGFQVRAETSEVRGSSVLPKLSNTANLISGAAARTLAGFALMPLSILKVRFESNLFAYPTMLGAAGDIYRKEGVRGFFHGYGATAIRDAPYAGMYVLFYEMLKKYIGAVADRQSSSEVTQTTNMQASRASSINFVSGLLAGSICSAISNPFDVLKTRIQLQPQKYVNIGHAIRKMAAEDGLRTLWNGLALRMGRKAISSAMAWTLYEEFMRQFSLA